MSHLGLFADGHVPLCRPCTCCCCFLSCDPSLSFLVVRVSLSCATASRPWTRTRQSSLRLTTRRPVPVPENICSSSRPWRRSCGFSFRAPRTRSKRSSTSRVATRTRALLRTHTWAPVICSNTPILETTKVAISRVFMCFSLCRCPSCRLNRHVWHLQVIGRCCSAWAIS